MQKWYAWTFVNSYFVYFVVFWSHFIWHLFLFLPHAWCLYIPPHWLNPCWGWNEMCAILQRTFSNDWFFFLCILLYFEFILLAFVPVISIKNRPSLVLIMAWIWNQLPIKSRLIGSGQLISNNQHHSHPWQTCIQKSHSHSLWSLVTRHC